MGDQAEGEPKMTTTDGTGAGVGFRQGQVKRDMEESMPDDLR